MNALQKHDYGLFDQNLAHLIGIDEAGRGALAGPVVAGACVLKKEFFCDVRYLELSAKINDSKQLSAESREGQYACLLELREEAALDFEVAAASVEEIWDLNILGATRLAMQRALEALAERAEGWKLPVSAADGPLFKSAEVVRLIVDGRPLKPFPYSHEGLVKGDGKSLAIAMASIAAKVSRDRIMADLATEYPDYGFELHKGYATAAHRSSIEKLGASSVHRALFLRKILAK